MSDDAIPTRLAALDKDWEWVSDAPSRADEISKALSELKSRLEAISDDDVNKKVLTILETNEETLPKAKDELSEDQRAQQDADTEFQNTANDLTRRVSALKAMVGG
jgi:peptidoglycan hydrolase CwlO-like protein